jgi:hypothetical protein
VDKMVSIDIEFIDSPLDYKILLGCSYIYMMKEVTLSVFCTMIFPNNGKVIIFDQLKYYDPHPTLILDNILPFIGVHHDFPSFVEMSMGIFKDSSLLSTYEGETPFITPPYSS